MQPETKQKILAGNYPLVGAAPKCPECGSTKTYYSCLAQNHLCTSCGTEFNGTSLMQPVGTLKKIKTSEMGTYYSLDTGKVIFISHSDMAFDFLLKSFRTKFEEDYWPLLWMLIKMSIPIGPIEFKNTSRPREGRLVEDPSDLYFLTKADLLRCGNIQDLTADKLLVSIKNSKTRPLGKIIFALGILGVGREWGEKLAKKFGSIDALGRATWKDLVLTPGLGASIARNILEFFHAEGNWKMIEKLRIAGVQLTSAAKVPKVAATTLANLEKQSRLADDLTNNSFYPQLIEKAKELEVTVIQIHDSLEFGGLLENQNKLLAWMKDKIDSILQEKVNPISGKTFMFTGRLETLTRAQAQAQVVAAGGLVGSGVSKVTDYLVVGDKPGSKLGHAAALGVKRITEQEFYNLLQGGN